MMPPFLVPISLGASVCGAQILGTRAGAGLIISACPLSLIFFPLPHATLKLDILKDSSH